MLSADAATAVATVASTTCGATTSSRLSPDNDGLTSIAVRLGFSMSEDDSSALSTGSAF